MTCLQSKLSVQGMQRKPASLVHHVHMHALVFHPAYNDVEVAHVEWWTHRHEYIYVL